MRTHNFSIPRPYRPASLVLPAMGALFIGTIGCENRNGDGLVREDEAALPGYVQFTVGIEPMISIGGLAGREVSDLFRVRGAIRLPDGRLFIADSGNRVLSFTASGSYVGSFGREGKGPGEFDGVAWLGIAGDSLVVGDFARRISLFTLDGRYVRSFTTPRHAVGLLPDGSPVLQANVRPATTVAGQVLYRGPQELVRADQEGNILNSIGLFLGPEYVYVPNSPRAYVWSDLATPSFAVGDGEIFVAEGDSARVLVFAASGGLERTIDIPQSLVPITRDELLESVTRLSLDPAVATAISTFPENKSYPAVTDLLIAESGDLWVRGTRRPGATHDTWFVVSAAGAGVGEAITPSQFRPLQIGEDFVLGVFRDSLGVESVEVRALSATPSLQRF